jgi:hypothetical protein
MHTRIIFALASVALLGACSHAERVSATTPTGSTTVMAPAVVAPAPGTVAVAPGGVVATPGVVAVSGSSAAAVPIGSAKYGVTSDCNAAAGGTAQGRTSATTMLDCGKLGTSAIR